MLDIHTNLVSFPSFSLVKGSFNRPYFECVFYFSLFFFLLLSLAYISFFFSLYLSIYLLLILFSLHKCNKGFYGHFFFNFHLFCGLFFGLQPYFVFLFCWPVIICGSLFCGFLLVSLALFCYIFFLFMLSFSAFLLSPFFCLLIISKDVFYPCYRFYISGIFLHIFILFMRHFICRLFYSFASEHLSSL